MENRPRIRVLGVVSCTPVSDDTLRISEREYCHLVHGNCRTYHVQREREREGGGGGGEVVGRGASERKPQRQQQP